MHSLSTMTNVLFLVSNTFQLGAVLSIYKHSTQEAEAGGRWAHTNLILSETSPPNKQQKCFPRGDPPPPHGGRGVFLDVSSVWASVPVLGLL